jgi:exopolysaccharide biosynthesis WecB/TagA/CpsF family protein
VSSRNSNGRKRGALMDRMSGGQGGTLERLPNSWLRPMIRRDPMGVRQCFGRRTNDEYALVHSKFYTVSRTLLSRLVSVKDSASRHALLRRLAQPRRTFVVDFVNAHAINMCARDRSIFESFLEADLLLRDGVGAAIACRAYQMQPGEDMNGTDLVPELLRLLPPKRVALYGTREPWLSHAVTAVSSMGHEVVDAQHGFHEKTAYATRVATYRPDVIVLGMGIPKQELVALDLRTDQTLKALVLNGGAIIDFLGGRFPRAPGFIRRARLEWLFRLKNEPRRLLRRYSLDVLDFMLRLAACAIVDRALRLRAGDPG